MNQEKSKSKVWLMIDTCLETHHFALWNEGLLWHKAWPSSLSTQIASVQLAELLQTSPKPAAIVMAKGPGSFTGLRFGHSLACALATSLNVKLIALSSFTAYGLEGKRSLVLFDARAGGLYRGVLNEQAELETPPLRWSKTISSNDMACVGQVSFLSPENESLNDELIGWPTLQKAHWNPQRWAALCMKSKTYCFPFQGLELEYLKPDHEVPSLKK
jgi:tRNA A37 threonylcarbamoyladenosine modification protein TsaB